MLRIAIAAGLVFHSAQAVAQVITVPEVPRTVNPYPERLESLCAALLDPNLLAKTAAGQFGPLKPLADQPGNETPEQLSCKRLMAWTGTRSAIDGNDIRLLHAKIQDQSISAAAIKYFEDERLAALPSPSLSALSDKVILGITDFVIKRAQQEAALYLQNQLQLSLCPAGEKHLFPATCNLLESLKDTAWSLPSVTVHLRESLKSDFRELPERKLAQIHSKIPATDKISAPQAQALSRKVLVLRVGVAAYRASRGPRSAADIFRGLSALNATHTCEGVTNAHALSGCNVATGNLKQAGLFYSTLEGSHYKPRHSASHLAPLYSGLGLALRLGEGDQFSFLGSGGIPDYAFIARVLNLLIDLARLQQESAELGERIVQLRETAAEKQEDLEKNLRGEMSARLRALNFALESIRRFASLACDDKNQGTLCSYKADVDELRKIETVLAAVVDDNYSRILLELAQIMRDQLGEDLKSDKAMRYAAVLIEISSAATSKEVTEVIERVAAPAGSYRSKFKRNMLSVTAVVGLAGGEERYTAAGVRQRHSFVAPFAPVGFHYTWTSGFGALFSVIDVGALAAEREQGTGAEKDSSVGWSQVLSPGAFFTWNVAESAPIIVGVGVAKTPKLIKTTTGNEVSSTRGFAFIGMDLTIFGF